ncbi:S8 family peptidase [Aquimarina sp. I32.4]|uniref:S8 family peptidase n=1 Tax=Aquimarina sp. I32.4 TaxID=2053903 RepID=UPI000CDE87D6|nr:S8 family peptidase [Aquimarina sp. I32.4]
MKNNITYKILTLILLFVTVHVFGQEKSDDFYYYKGEKFFLDVNTKTISISFEGENSINSFKSLHSNSEKITEITEDNARATVISIDDKTTNKKHIKSYYMEISMTKDMSKANYYKKIESYKKLPNVLMASPAYMTKGGTEFGLSNNFYVKLRDKNDVDVLYKKAKELDIEVLGYNEYMPLWFTLSVTPKSKLNAIQFANVFYEMGWFESTEPAFVYHDLQNSNDSHFNDQWTLRNTGQSGGISGVDIKIEQAWNISTGNNVNVAVVDQGIEMNHPDFQANIVGTGFDAQTNTIPSQVRGAHGVACAGIIGAVKDNNIGIAGVAPSSGLISVSVGFSGTTIQMLANGVNWAWQNGADVISNSWGGGSPSSIFDNAVNNALSNGRNGLGSIVVFSSGNDNVNGAQYPSNSNPLILCVGAIDRCGIRSGRIDIIPQSCDPWCSNCRKGSSYGTPLDVVAGGTSTPTTDRQGDVSGNGDYNPWANSPPNNYSNYDYNRWFGGTSAACPYVAGVAALVLSVDSSLTVHEVNDIIEQSAQKVTTNLYTYSSTNGRLNGTWNNQLGYGLVNAYQAVLLAQNCQNDLVITQNVVSGQTDIQEASNVITASNTIFSGATAAYDAGTVIKLKSGFTARSGSSFRAYIEGCSARNLTREEPNSEQELITYENIEVETNSLEKTEIVSVYPNPTNNMLTVSSKEHVKNWELKDHIGRYTEKSKLKGKYFYKDRFSINHLPVGLYILKVTLTNGNIIYKNIVKK